jgi:hypothetical protein
LFQNRNTRYSIASVSDLQRSSIAQAEPQHTLGVGLVATKSFGGA